jgi:hypothetical protein
MVSSIPSINLTPRGTSNDLTSWTEAAVCDRLFGFYRGVFNNEDLARHAARLHWSCWRAHLGQLNMQGRAARQALARVLRDAKLDVALIARADAELVDEMTDLALSRYRRAPQQAKSHITRIVSAAMQMAAGRTG